MKGAGSDLVCKDDPAALPYIQLPQQRGGIGGFYDRSGRLLCARNTVLAGGTFTVFSINTANYNRDVDSFPQHVMVFMCASL